MSPKLVTKALRDMSSQGLMTRTRVARMKGEPNFKYKLNVETAISKVKRRFESIQRPYSESLLIKQQIIDYILCDSELGLTISQKLLFAILWLQASDAGVLENIGTSILAKKVGCSKDSVRRHLKSLVDKGLLKLISPGFTAEALFGLKDSVYLLTPPEISPYLILNLPRIEKKNNDIVISAFKILSALQQDYSESKEILDKIGNDLHRADVQRYFLYWFWRHAFSIIESVINKETLPLAPYIKQRLFYLPDNNKTMLAKSLFSSVLLESYQTSHSALQVFIQKIHKLAIELLLEVYPEVFEMYSCGGLPVALKALMPQYGIYKNP